MEEGGPEEDSLQKAQMPAGAKKERKAGRGSEASRTAAGAPEEEKAAGKRPNDNRPAAGVCCGEKRKRRDDAEFSDLIHRLNRVEGQIRGIRSMVENDAYCIDILTQVSAAGAALTAFSRVLLDSHVRTCVVEDIRSGRDEKTEELLAVLQKFMR